MATDPREAVPEAAHSPQLDGLRAVAVAAVAWSHWLPDWQLGVPLGAGVHLFFVLSGFLITRILLGLRAAPDRGPAIGRFYVRRALRLFPAFYLVLGVAVWADVPLARATWPWHAGYLSNVFMAGVAQWQGHLSHFWSLAVEEQFYLLWPWLVVVVPDRGLPALIGGTVLLGPVARLVAAAEGLGEPFWALVPGGSADSLGLGAWLAWAGWRRPGIVAMPARGAVAAAALAGWLVLAMSDRTTPLPAGVAVWRQLLQGIVFAWIVAAATRGFRAGPGRALLGHAAVRYVGRISYGAYLIHAFAPVAVFAVARGAGLDGVVPTSPGGRAALYALTTLGLAALMWRLVEQPALRLKGRVPYVSTGA